MHDKQPLSAGFLRHGSVSGSVTDKLHANQLCLRGHALLTLERHPRTLIVWRNAASPPQLH